MKTLKPLLSILALLCMFEAPGATAETAYFVVTTPESYELYLLGFHLGDAYVLPLHEPEDILQARQLVDNGGGRSIITAWVTKGSDDINRNWIGAGMPLWSWHVSEFQGFSDSAVEICDGNPTATESESQNWSEGDGTQICYWSYRVVDEISTVPSKHTGWGQIKALFD